MPQKMPASDIFFNASNRFDEGHTPGSTILLSLSLQAVMVIFTIVGECLLILLNKSISLVIKSLLVAIATPK